MRWLTWILGLGLLSFVAVGLIAAPVGAAAVEHFAPANSSATEKATSIAATGPPSIELTYTTLPPPFTVVPFNLTISVSVINATISPTNMSLWATIYDVTNEFPCSVVSLNSSVATGVSTYTLDVNATNLAPAIANPGCNPYADKMGFIAGATITNSVTTNGSSTEVSTYLNGLQPTVVGLLSPLTAETGLGNVTFLAFASGQFISGLSIAVSLNSTVVFHAVLLQSSNYSGQYTPVVWDAASAGAYKFSLALTTTYGNDTYYNGTLTITSPGSTTITVTTQTSTWHNQTLIPGVSPAVGGTILMVIGLLVGIIAALLIGRSMANTSAKPAPAQQWSGEAKANTCSVCGQSFGSAEELAAHQKSEHGMS